MKLYSIIFGSLLLSIAVFSFIVFIVNNINGGADFSSIIGAVLAMLTLFLGLVYFTKGVIENFKEEKE
jgi:predicted Co/Zn/Cd cation transporter (cation efflux family)